MSKPVWKPDDSAAKCKVCRKDFSLFTRKHHCRACGEVVCDACLVGTMPVAGYPHPEKACTPCLDDYKHNEVYPASRVAELCDEYKKRDTDVPEKALKLAKVVVETAKVLVPPPFSILVSACSKVVELAENAVSNTGECKRLAQRIVRINFILLDLTAAKGVTAAYRQCAADLAEVFKKAVDLLQRFQGSKTETWAQRIKAQWKFYLKNLADEFNDIHKELTVVIQETTLSVSSQDLKRCAAPTLDEIRVSVRDELAHVTEELERMRQENGEATDNISQQLQQMLDSPVFAKCPAKRALYSLRDVDIDWSTVLGKGGFGTVYAGRLFGMTDVAVKVTQTSDTAAVEDEIRRTMRVRHPNVVRVFGIIAPDGDALRTAAVVMERLGATLEDLIQTTALPLSVKMKYTVDIIAALERIHSTDDGVVHFDLKPANILLTVDRRTAKIIDFGASQTRTTIAMDASALARGTVPFMAPELLTGLSNPTTACDVYSFAILMLELWCGVKAWSGTPDVAIVTAVKDGCRPLSHVEMIAAGASDSIIAVIEACWAQLPHDRPSFAQLSMIRSIENFYDAPQRVWPAFLQSVEVQASVSAGATRIVPPLPSATQFSKFSVEQVRTVLLDQEIVPDICAWIFDKRLNGDALTASGTKIVSRLRMDPANFDEFHVDALERIVTKLASQRAQDEIKLTKATEQRAAAIEEAKRREAEEDRQRAEQRRLEQEAEHRRKLAQEKAADEAAERERIKQAAIAKEQAEQAARLEVEKRRRAATDANRRTIDTWINSVNLRTEQGLQAYLNVVSEQFAAHVTYLKDGQWTTANGIKSGLPPHYRKDLWGTGCTVVDVRIQRIGPDDAEFTYSCTYPSGYRSNLEAHMYFDPVSILRKFEVRVL